MNGLRLWRLDSRTASRAVIQHHYLHRRPPITDAFGLYRATDLVGVVTYGTPASRHLQMSACPSDPSKVVELNRLWLHDSLPKNTASWFVSRTLKQMAHHPRIVVSYADPVHGHYGYVYRALNFRYAGWTDMDRKTPRLDYVPATRTDPETLLPSTGRERHTREASRSGFVEKRRRVPKVKYWTVVGSPTDRRILIALCGWPSMDWHSSPPPNDLHPLVANRA